MSALVVLAYWVPGLVIGLALRLRGWTLAAAAPVLTFGGVALGTYALGRTGIPWNLLTVVLWFLVLAAVVGVPTWLVARRRARTEAAEAGDGAAAGPVVAKRPLRDNVVVLVGVVAGMAVGALTFLKGIKSLNTVNQDWDAPFHGNAIRWIAEHETSLPSALGQIANLPGKANYFYPNTYHALLAPLLDKVAAMPELLNLAALSMVLAWPLGVAAMALAWRVPPLAAAAAAAVSTWFSAFPYDSLWRGPLWPYVAGVALVPATLALTRKIFTERGLGGPIAVALAMAGLVGLHTSLAFVMAVYALMLLVALVVRLEPVDWKVARIPLLLTAVLAVLAALPLALPAFANAAGVTSAGWPEFATPSEAFGQLLLWSPTVPFPQWFLGFAALAGIVLMVLHKRVPWVVAAWVVLGGLYAACASINSKLVDTLTGPFYNDAWRFAALLPLAGALAVGELVWTVATRIGEKSESRLGARAAFAVPVALALVGLLGLAVLTKGAYLGRNTERLGYSNHDYSTVTPGEREAYRWLKEHSDGKPVLNDIGDGSVWMYALAGVKPVEWTFYGAGEESTAGVLSFHLKEIATNPKVEKAIEDLDVRYVLVGRGMVRPDMPRSPGLKDLDAFPYVRKVYSNPDATVYELVEPGDQRP
ncbi:DUF6541 family protein [Saccharothrix sp.]|uniref:DUF6541 family protein n=1 Tax=Saccharothrix sp. TaxID=1873460 RepID=UPI002811F731|nr:DUF6541 family protein [Saccharothrix sp.]